MPPPVVCVHGLSRVGRDFDPLAAALADETYADGPMLDRLAGFCEALALDPVRYVGTSIGGTLGIALAGGPLADRVSHLVVNDVSPDPETDADRAAIKRIGEYVPHPPTRESVTGLEAYYHDVYQGRFSPMTDAEWRCFTITSARRTDDGGVAPAYDPRILDYDDSKSATAHGSGGDSPEDRGPWDAWAAIDAELMVVRGTDSAILPADVFERMTDVRPDAATLAVDCGHAPALNVPGQIEPIRAFLSGEGRRPAAPDHRTRWP